MKLYEHKLRVFYRQSKGINFVLVPTIAVNYKKNKFKTLTEKRVSVLIIWLIFSYMATWVTITHKRVDV